MEKPPSQSKYSLDPNQDDDHDDGDVYGNDHEYNTTKGYTGHIRLVVLLTSIGVMLSKAPGVLIYTVIKNAFIKLEISLGVLVPKFRTRLSHLATKL